MQNILRSWFFVSGAVHALKEDQVYEMLKTAIANKKHSNAARKDTNLSKCFARNQFCASCVRSKPKVPAQSGTDKHLSIHRIFFGS